VRTSSLFEALYTTSMIRVLRVQPTQNTQSKFRYCRQHEIKYRRQKQAKYSYPCLLAQYHVAESVIKQVTSTNIRVGKDEVIIPANVIHMTQHFVNYLASHTHKQNIQTSRLTTEYSKQKYEKPQLYSFYRQPSHRTTLYTIHPVRDTTISLAMQAANL